jgi:hypothetical protein
MICLKLIFAKSQAAGQGEGSEPPQAEGTDCGSQPIEEGKAPSGQPSEQPSGQPDADNADAPKPLEPEVCGNYIPPMPSPLMRKACCTLFTAIRLIG